MPAWTPPSRPHRPMGGVPKGRWHPHPLLQGRQRHHQARPVLHCRLSLLSLHPPQREGGLLQQNTVPPRPSSAGFDSFLSVAGSSNSVGSVSRLCVAAHQCTPCRFRVIGGHLRPQPTNLLTGRPSVIPSGTVVCRYHGGGRHDETHVLVVAQVEGIGPVLLILEGGHRVCP